MNGYATYPSLRDRVVFVTGGGSGIGESIVEHFCDQGARVAFADIARDASEALVRRLGGAKRPLYIPCDLRDVEALRAAIEQAREALGPIRVLVNNAAHDERHKPAEVTPEYWDDRIAVNLRHVFFAAQAVYPQMKEAGGGSIVNFGSTSWMIKASGMPAYTAAKAGIHGLTRGLAADWGKDGIRLNTVVPGWVMTERQRTLWLDEAGERLIDANQALKARVQPADLARMVLFLAADDSAMCTAQNWIVDGGWV